MKTINIKGKEYIPVNERIKYFRENYKTYRIDSNFLELNETFCIIKTIIYNENNEIVASGFAREVNGDSYINKTSYIENCETSAIGRALGCFGIGIDESLSSANEVINATVNQNNDKFTKKIKVLSLDSEYTGNLKGYNCWGEVIETDKGRKALDSYIEFCDTKNITVKLNNEFQNKLNIKEKLEAI